jgi:hypothetical protein
MDSLTQEIEAYLRAEGGWVSKRQICERFGIPERRTRADDDRPGLLDDFAVSSTCEGQSGFIHNDFLPTADYLPIKHRIKRHAIGELRKTRRWDAARKNSFVGNFPDQLERFSRQATLFPL